MMNQNIPIDLLRTFVLIVGNSSFSRTAKKIGRTQSATSLQMKRLETFIGAALFHRRGKSLALTPQGEVLLQYARQILALNDECLDRISGQLLLGQVKIGVPSDFAISFLPQILGEFSEANPNVALHVTCELSADLTAQIGESDFDLVLALHEGRRSPFLVRKWQDPVDWVCSKTHVIETRMPLPLILFPEGCYYRARILATLTERNIPYKIVFTSPNLAGLQAAIESGLGVTALSEATIPKSLRRFPAGQALPALDDVEVGLYWDERGMTEPTRQLASFITQTLDRRLARA